MHDDPFDFDRRCEPVLEWASVQPTGEFQLQSEYRGRIGLYTPHDGGAIPKKYRFREDGTALVDPQVLKRKYLADRDWGANAVAEELAAALALPGYARCRLARVLLDFNRFPGSTQGGEHDPLETLAIGPLYADVLKHREKMELLEDYYDAMSNSIEEILGDKLISIGIHTYDELNASATQRADISIISLPLSYQRHARMTFGVFDPLYPDDLAESTCSRILRDRISLNLERSGFRVTHNHPYPMPDGSIELRAQVWFFFRFLQSQFQAANPETVDDPAYRLVWTMLLDTNLRLEEAESLRSFLHRYRKVEPHNTERFSAALDAYNKVKSFLRSADIEAKYRRWAHRPSSIGLEVRKDLLCTVDAATGAPKKPTKEQLDTARMISQAIASAIKTYLETDYEFI